MGKVLFLVYCGFASGVAPNVREMVKKNEPWSNITKPGEYRTNRPFVITCSTAISNPVLICRPVGSIWGGWFPKGLDTGRNGIRRLSPVTDKSFFTESPAQGAMAAFFANLSSGGTFAAFGRVRGNQSLIRSLMDAPNRNPFRKRRIHPLRTDL
jgi:hypothetical protein